MSEYFSQLERIVVANQEVLQDGETRLSLRSRMTTLKNYLKTRATSLGLQMRELANADAVGKFNSAQSAAFLRSDVGSNKKTSRGLVNRAGEELDFDEIVRNEVFEMSKHRAEIEAMDSTSHAMSYVSVATTVEGLLGLFDLCDAEAVEDSTLGGLSAFEIISLANIVGIPVQSVVGDYPDPFRYNIKHLYVGHYASLSDIVAAKDAGVELTIPGLGPTATFDDVIPVFDNAELYRLVYKHAPALLSYTSSIGMRRVIADIPMTTQAQLVTALIKIIRIMDSNRSEVVVTTAQKIFKSLEVCMPVSSHKIQTTAIGDAIRKYRKETKLALEAKKKNAASTASMNDEDNDDAAAAAANARKTIVDRVSTLPQALIVPNHTLGELFIPLLRLYANPTTFIKEGVTEEEIAAFTRALYTREVWATLRGLYRGKEDGNVVIQSSINQLIGFDPNSIPRPNDLFVADIPASEVQFIANFDGIATPLFNQLSKRIEHLNIITVLPHLARLLPKGKLDEFKDHDNLPRVWLREYRDPMALVRQPTNATSSDFEQAMVEYYQFMEFYDENDYYIDANGNNQYDEPTPPMPANPGKVLDTVAPVPAPTDTNKEEHIEQSIQLFNSTFDLNMELPREIDMFKYINIVLAFTHYDNTHRATIPDICPSGAFSAFKTAFDDHLLQLQQGVYDVALKQKREKEDTAMVSRLVDGLVAATPLSAAIDLWRNGVTEGARTFILSNMQSIAFRPFYNALIDDTNTNVKHRLEKLRILILGTEYGTNAPVWNNGRVLFIPKLNAVARIFTIQHRDLVGSIPPEVDWNLIQTEYRERKKHIYRDNNLPNRHQHCITKASFWAIGYNSFEEFELLAPPQDVAAYRELHIECCGLGDVDVRKRRIRHWEWTDSQKEEQQKKLQRTE